MLNKKISPSMMCADVFALRDCIRQLEAADIELLHVDVMDGSFVPNFTLGTDYIRQLKKETHIPLDLHLMIDEPERKLDWFAFGEGDYVSVHCESTKHLQRALAAIRQRGAHPMVAVNPATPLSVLDYVSDDVDAVLIMTVNPGFAGQKLVEATLPKIRALRDRLDAAGKINVEIEVDGNVSFENAKRMSDAGANIFVAGTSSIFRKELTIAEGARKLRDAIAPV